MMTATIFIGIVFASVAVIGAVAMMSEASVDKDINPKVEVGLKQSLHASITRACRSCGAPGHVDGKHVGNVCPACGAGRPDDIPLGEIWSRNKLTGETKRRPNGAYP